MNTPINAFYERLSQDELYDHLAQVESEIGDIHTRRAALSVEESAAQEHREAIQRALGCFVLNDKRTEIEVI